MNCRSCGNTNLVEVLSLGDIALSDFRTDNLVPEKYPLDLMFCENCYLTQLKETTPQDLLYTDNYGYRSGINNTIKADLKEIVARTSELAHLEAADAVLDIAANDGTLLSNYPGYLYRVAVDPVKKFKEDSQKHADVAIDDFFSYDAVRKETNRQFKAITTISMFYDLDDPNSFVADIVRLLREDGVWTVQQNYLATMLSNNAYCNIVHEHLEYYSLIAMENLLARHNLEVFKVEQNTINGGSFRTYICHKGEREIDHSVELMRQRELAQGLATITPYHEFAERVKTEAKRLHDLLERLHYAGATVAIYGASTRGNTLLQYSGIDKDRVEYAIERNPEKWGKKISSLQIPIVSEEEARKLRPQYMLILPWFFYEEFKEREKDYLNAGGVFILPLPTMSLERVNGFI